ncbi:uncharacterized protein B0I36DRAFT_32355 [Microdochium trichocladiopsis]|uniref:Uncharacterized protein n=1 Tax=Microdochium trichocladiopsis TaxID=1682393 RepID=A0A9P8XWI9_9PEZI|nr:uncharacterized protein B0I36DRAFT_32355 [Microdochium trichocladiopsis]KAH7021485.1 hypothetical protein B0I36DRAFT_32355 [Microdochium trichocladiopsis]
MEREAYLHRLAGHLTTLCGHASIVGPSRLRLDGTTKMRIGGPDNRLVARRTGTPPCPQPNRPARLQWQTPANR